MTDKIKLSPKLIYCRDIPRIMDIVYSTKAEATVSLGLNPQRYNELSKRDAHRVADPRESLRARLIQDFPDMFKPDVLSFREVFEALYEIDDSFTPKMLTIMLGLGPNSAPRLMDGGTMELSSRTSLEMIYKFIKRAATKTEKRERLEILLNNVAYEAEARGLNLDRVWRRGWYTIEKVEPKAKENAKAEK